MSVDVRQVEQAYAAMEELGEHREAGAAIGVHELTSYVFDPDFALSEAQTAWLLADPAAEGARAVLRDLQSRSAFAAIPMVAAASDGAVLERTFDGISIRLTIEADSPVAALLVRFPEGRRPTGPLLLVMVSPRLGMAKVRLAPPDADGESYRNLNVEKVPEFARLAAILREATATGSLHEID